MAAEDDSDFSDVDLDTIRERAGRHAAAKRSAQREAPPLEAVVAAPAKAVAAPALPKLELPKTPTLPKVDVQLPKEGKEVALAAFALATGAAASALKAAAAGPRERERAASYSGSGDKLEALVASPASSQAARTQAHAFRGNS